MAVKGPFEYPHYWMGLSTDTKPTNAAIGDEFFETNTRLWYIYDGSTWYQKVTAASGPDVIYTSTDPATSAAVTTAIVDAYGGVLITLTGAGNAQTIQNPTITTAGKRFTVINNNTSTNTIAVNGITLAVGTAQTWVWDGSAWIEIDLGITVLPVTVVQGGTGRATGATAYALIAAGTTATGAQQSLAAGATTEILVGGGASALPVWTAATGTGAPVRATSPDLAKPTLTVGEVAGHTAGALTAIQCANTTIINIGQGANDVNKTLPTEAEGLAFKAHVGEPSANYWRFTAATAGTMTVDGVLGKDYAQFSTPGKDNYFIAHCVKSAPEPSGILTSAGLAIGTTNTAVSSDAFTYYIAGVKYVKAAVDDGTAPGNDVIPQTKFGAVAFDIDSAGTITAVEAADNATGYDTALLAVAGLPAAAVTKARMGYVTASKSDGDFTFGTTALDAENTTVAYTSTAVYTATYHWVVSTGAGTVTTN